MGELSGRPIGLSEMRDLESRSERSVFGKVRVEDEVERE